MFWNIPISSQSFLQLTPTPSHSHFLSLPLPVTPTTSHSHSLPLPPTPSHSLPLLPTPSHLANSFRGNHWRTVFAFPVFPTPEWESLPQLIGNEHDMVDTLPMVNLHRWSPFSYPFFSFPNSVPPWHGRLGEFSKRQQSQQHGEPRKIVSVFVTPTQLCLFSTFSNVVSFYRSSIASIVPSCRSATVYIFSHLALRYYSECE